MRLQYTSIVGSPLRVLMYCNKVRCYAIQSDTRQDVILVESSMFDVSGRISQSIDLDKIPHPR